MKKIKKMFAGMVAAYAFLAVLILLIWPSDSLFWCCSLVGYSVLMLVAVLLYDTIDWVYFGFYVSGKKQRFHRIVFICFCLMLGINLALKLSFVPDTLVINCAAMFLNSGVAFLLFFAAEYWCEPKNWRDYMLKGMFLKSLE